MIITKEVEIITMEKTIDKAIQLGYDLKEKSKKRGDQIC